MKTAVAFVLALILAVSFSSCANDDIPHENSSSLPASKSESIPDISDIYATSEAEAERESMFGAFGATDFGTIQLLNDETAFIVAHNRDSSDESGFLTTFSEYDLETGKIDPIHEGHIFMEFSNVLKVSEVALSGPWLYTGKEIIATGKDDSEPEVYPVAGYPGYSDFCFDTQTFISISGNKIYATNPKTGETRAIFEYPCAEMEFIFNIKISPDGEYIVFNVNIYEGYNIKSLVCINSSGEVVFENIFDDFGCVNCDIRWLSCNEFAFIYANEEDEESTAIRVYGTDGEIKRQFKFDFIYDDFENTVSMPCGIMSEYIRDAATFSYALWLVNFEDGSCSKVYTSPDIGKQGIIRGFDLSPSGKTLAWIEYDVIRTMTLGE